MFRLLVCLLILVLSESAAIAAPASSPRAPALSWVFDTHQDKEFVPHSKVYLRVGTKRVLIEPNAEFEFNTVSRKEFKDQKVPALALTACWGWFAGGGEVLYVVQHKKALRVYRRWEDEQAPDFPYKRIRTITLP